MAFATDSASSHAETLYLSANDDLGSLGANGPGPGGEQSVAKLDLTTMKLSVIGDFSGALSGVGAESTGTGTRRFGFFSTLAPSATLASATGENKYAFSSRLN